MSAVFSSQGHGAVTVRVDPGVEFLLSPFNVPWKLGQATSEHERLAAISCEEGARISRAIARSAGKVGVVRGEGQELFLSVKLSDKCPHNDDMHRRKACGHVYCQMCDSHVDSSTRIVLKGPGPLVRCN